MMGLSIFASIVNRAARDADMAAVFRVNAARHAV